MSTILRSGREALGWSRERMAANVFISEDELEHWEEYEEQGGFVDFGSKPMRDIMTIFEARKVTVKIVSVVWPQDDASIAALKLYRGEIATLSVISMYGERGMMVSDLDPRINALRADLMLQTSMVRRTTHLNFDGEPVEFEERPPELRVRLSKRGKVALAYHQRLAEKAVSEAPDAA